MEPFNHIWIITRNVIFISQSSKVCWCDCQNEKRDQCSHYVYPKRTFHTHPRTPLLCFRLDFFISLHQWEHNLRAVGALWKRQHTIQTMHKKTVCNMLPVRHAKSKDGCKIQAQNHWPSYPSVVFWFNAQKVCGSCVEYPTPESPSIISRSPLLTADMGGRELTCGEFPGRGEGICMWTVL